MSRRRSGGSDSFWLWDGETEFEGHLLSHDEGRLTARLRLLRPWKIVGNGPGKPVLRDWLERQRVLVGKVCFGQSVAIRMGALLEFQLESLQPSNDAQFDYVLAGRFFPVADEHLEALSELSSGEAFQYLQSRQSGPRSKDPYRPGESAVGVGGA